MLFNIALYIFAICPIIVLILLGSGRFTTPYGRLVSTSWGALMIPAKLGWIIMESPASIIFIVFLYIYHQTIGNGVLTLFFVWQFHYFYRSFIYPFQIKSKNAMPVSVMCASLAFQLINPMFQAYWIFVVSPDSYGAGYLISPHFIIGLILFLSGTYINRQSDSILRNLRKDGETGYKIPYGFLFKYVSCPNYLGEMIIWLGWGVMLNSLAGYAFFMWTIANLLPRALSSHKWYIQKFEDYPKDRKALVPFIL